MRKIEIAKKNRSTRKNRNSRKNNNAAMMGGKRRKSRKLSSGAREWQAHMMKVYREMKARNPATKLGDAMRAAKKTYRK